MVKGVTRQHFGMLAPPSLTRRHALFLDFDGTLVDIAAQPQAVQVRPDVVASLRALHEALGGAVAIVTGRTAADIDRFLAPLHLPLACEHGARYRLGDRSGGVAALRLQPVLDALRPLLQRHPELRAEPKNAGIALHYRQAPQLEALCRQALEGALRCVPGAELLQGKCVLEVKPTAVSKGGAILRFMDEPLFTGRVPLFIGDDVTDESGFVAVQSRGGLGIKVGDGATQALARLESPPALRAWLAGAAAALAGPRLPRAAAGEGAR